MIKQKFHAPGRLVEAISSGFKVRRVERRGWLAAAVPGSPLLCSNFARKILVVWGPNSVGRP